MDVSARDEFYKTLADDLAMEGKESVLYQYLEGEQEKKAESLKEKDLSKTRSYQVRIRYYWKRLRAEDISPEKYLHILFSILLQKPQFCKSSGRTKKQDDDFESSSVIGYVSENPQPLLEKILDAAFDKEQETKKVKFAAGMKEVCRILEEGEGAEYEKVRERLEEKGFWEYPYEELEELTAAVLDVAVSYDIKEFFFGTIVEQQDSYSVAKRSKDGGKEADKSRAERTDKSLKLMDFYCRKKGKSLFASGLGADGITPPKDMECDALYRCLKENGNDEVFVPLLIDPVTGCGIYLIGKSYFEGNCISEDQIYKLKNAEELCSYGILNLDDDYGEDVKTGYHIWNEFGDFKDYNSARFDNIRFGGREWSYEQACRETLEVIREKNGKMPEGISKAFQKYFQDDLDTSF